MQISYNSDRNIFLLSILLCTDSVNRAFETTDKKIFHDIWGKLIIILRILIKEMKIFLTGLIFPKNRGF